MWLVNSRMVFGVSALSLGAWSFAAPILAGGLYEGVVTAPAIVVRSPASGKMDWVASENARLIVGQVVGEVSGANGDIEALKQQIGSLKAMSLDLARNASVFSQSRVQFLQDKVDEARSMRDILELDFEEATRKSDNLSKLAATGALSREEAIAQKAAARKLKLQIEMSQHVIDKAEVELEAARSGTFIGEGYNDVPYSVQRKVDIDLRIADLDRERKKANVSGDLVSGNEKLVSPVNGVVSASAIVQGQPVDRGSTLMNISDCDRLAVSLDMPAKRAEELAEGVAVKLSMAGNPGNFEGRVLRVSADHGANATSDNYQVSVEVLSKELKGICPIGRRVSVSIGGEADRGEQLMNSIVSVVFDSLQTFDTADAPTLETHDEAAILASDSHKTTLEF